MNQRALPGMARQPRKLEVVSRLTETEAILVIPGLRTVSELNMREHWAVRARRAQEQRRTVLMILNSQLGPWNQVPACLPLEITLSRSGRGRLDDDNLAGAFKHVRDGVADWLRMDDGHRSLRWRYEQSKGDTAVTIRLNWGV